MWTKMELTPEQFKKIYDSISTDKFDTVSDIIRKSYFMRNMVNKALEQLVREKKILCAISGKKRKMYKRCVAGIEN